MIKLKYAFSILFFLLFIKSSFSQGSVNIEFGGSYGFGVFSNSVETFVNTKQEENSYFSENKKFSLGGGLGIFANGLYHFQENIALGFGIHKNFEQEVVFVEINSISGIISENTRTLSASRFSLRPSVQLNTSFEKINTYLQMGITINFNKQKLHESVEVDQLKTEYFWEYEGKSRMGFFATWGVSYNFSEKIALNIGISMESFQYSPTKNHLQKLTKDGSNVPISNLQEIDKSVDFTDWLSDQYSQYPDPNKPLQSHKQNFVYHNLSVLMSLSYRL